MNTTLRRQPKFLPSCPLLGSVIVAGLLLLGLVTKASAQYSFLNLIDSTGPLSSFGLELSLNNAGVVAFRAGVTTDIRGVYTSNGSVVTTIMESHDRFSGFDEPSINDAGTVASIFRLGAGDFVFTGNGGPVTIIADTLGELKDFGAGLSINAAGNVVFTAGLDAGGGGNFVGNGGPLTLIASPSGSYPSINDAGTVAFRRGFTHGIYTTSGGPLTTIALVSEPYNQLSAPAINNAGTVAFAAGVLDNYGGLAIFTGNGGPLTLIADTSGPFAGFNADPWNSPSINDAGTVAFSGWLDDGGGGLYVSSGGNISEVLVAGDTLFGSTALGARGSSESLNDRGQIAFFYSLDNGVSGIALATPVPEPSSLALLAGAVAGFCTTRKRKRQ